MRHQASYDENRPARCAICWAHLDPGQPGVCVRARCPHQFHRSCLASATGQPDNPPEQACPTCSDQVQLADDTPVAGPGTIGAVAAPAQAPAMWVRPLRVMEPPPQARLEHFATGLNPSQRHALLQTRQRYLVLVQGPPGTGKTHLSAATCAAWAEAAPSPAVVVAAAPSNVACNHVMAQTIPLLPQRAVPGRLGNDESVFDASRIQHSVVHRADGALHMSAGKRRAVNQRSKGERQKGAGRTTHRSMRARPVLIRRSWRTTRLWPGPA